MKRIVLNDEQKEFVVSNRGMQTEEMAKIIGINPVSMARIRRQLNADCTCISNYKITDEIKNFIFELSKDSSITYVQMKREVESKYGVSISTSSIGNMLNNHGISRKLEKGVNSESLKELFRFNKRMDAIKKIVEPGKRIKSRGRRFEIKEVYSNYVLTTKNTCINYYDIDGVIK